MRTLLAIAALALAACSAAPVTVEAPEQGEVISLGLSGDRGLMQDDARFGRIVRNVGEPTLTVYPADPARTTGASMIVAPGGGFHMLSIENEGAAVARWLNERGVTAFVLRYRLVQTGDDFALVMMRRLINRKDLDAAVAPALPLATADGQAAIRYVREHAARWSLKPDRIGIVGFSAGGYVAVRGLQQGSAADRPDFVAAIYPGLLPDPLGAPEKSPPLFVLVADDDTISRGDSERLANAWKAKSAPVDLVVYPNGGHGFGMAPTGKSSDAWLKEFEKWLRAQGALAR